MIKERLWPENQQSWSPHKNTRLFWMPVGGRLNNVRRMTNYAATNHREQEINPVAGGRQKELDSTD